MGDHAQVEVGLVRLQRGQHLAGVVARAVVGDDDLELIRQPPQHARDMAHRSLDDGSLVVRGKHRRDAEGPLPLVHFC